MEDRPGIAFLPDASPRSADRVLGRLDEHRREGDLVVVSLHWGSNWGYEVDLDQIRFAHTLTEGGVDIVFGHSSHHPRPVEVHHGRLILYGCGDLIDDYEGIAGFEEYRDDLRLLLMATVVRATGELRELTMVPMLARRLRLVRPPARDVRWLGATLDEASRRFGSRVALRPDGVLSLELG